MRYRSGDIVVVTKPPCIKSNQIYHDSSSLAEQEWMTEADNNIGSVITLTYFTAGAGWSGVQSNGSDTGLYWLEDWLVLYDPIREAYNRAMQIF